MFNFIKKIFFNDKNTNQNVKGFTPYKIVSNDNTLKSIVNDYDTREEEAKQDLEARLGKALVNDVKWSVLQNISLECILNKDIKLCINVEYQRGLLLQKEKKYKQAISHYSMGLYYLVDLYNITKINPINHIIDYITCDKEVFEMGQYKFVNKIKLCSQYDNLSTEKLIETMKQLINITSLRNVIPNDFINMYQQYLSSDTNKQKEHQGNVISTENEGMVKITEFDNGNIELSTNKDYGLIDENHHYTDSVEDIKLLKRMKKNVEAINLLEKAVKAVENESKNADNGWVLAPWYYEQLAIMYRKEKRYTDEVNILERYINHPSTTSAYTLKFEERLKKVKAKYFK